MQTHAAAETGPRPQHPEPEVFGLTAARVNKLREPIRWNDLLNSRWFWIGDVAVGLLLATRVYEGAQSVVAALVVGYVGFFASGFAAGIVGSLVNAVWRRFQPDYPQYVKYRRALANYRVRIAGWLRLQESWWQALDGRRFEFELSVLLGKLGYAVTRTGGAGDGGVDLVLSRAGREVIVQCKAHRRPIGPGPVRDLYGTMNHRGAEEAWLVTTTGFSRAARDFADGKRIRLLGVRELLKAEGPLDSK
jgi:Restriction endonuclease